LAVGDVVMRGRVEGTEQWWSIEGPRRQQLLRAYICIGLLMSSLADNLIQESRFTCGISSIQLV